VCTSSAFRSLRPCWTGFSSILSDKLCSPAHSCREIRMCCVLGVLQQPHPRRNVPTADRHFGFLFQIIGLCVTLRLRVLTRDSPRVYPSRQAKTPICLANQRRVRCH
jgi:hypothetical protein